MKEVDPDLRLAVQVLLTSMIVMVVFLFIAVGILVSSLEVRCGADGECVTSVPRNAWMMAVANLAFGVAAAVAAPFIRLRGGRSEPVGRLSP
jgi:hypothetical protein